MKRLVFFLLMLTSLFESGRTQYVYLDEKKYSDSLENIVRSNENDSMKAVANFYLSDYWSDLDTNKSKTCLQLANELIGKNRFLLAMYYFYKGQYAYDKDADFSRVYYMKADSILKNDHSKQAYVVRAKIWNAYGTLQQRFDNEKEYLNILLNKCIPFVLQAKDSLLLGRYYAYVGTVFMNTGEYEEAQRYYDKAIKTLVLHPNGYLASAYILAARNAIDQSDMRSARKYLDNAGNLLSPYPGSQLNISYYQAKGIYDVQVKQYQKALISFDKGLDIVTRLNRPRSIESFMYMKCDAYEGLGEYQKALKTLLYLVQHPTRSLAQVRLNYYLDIHTIYAYLGNFRQAYQWQSKAYSVLDSIYNSDVKNKMNELDIQYQASEKAKLILTLEAAKTQAELTARNNKLYAWLFGAGCLLLLLVAVFSLLFYKNNKKLIKQKEISYRQELKEMKQQQQLEVTQAMLEGEERERTRVARDLHDGLGGMLAGVKINLSGWVKNNCNIPYDNGLDKVIVQLDNSVGELRRIAGNMMPESLLKFGLEAALADLCRFYSNDDLVVDFQPMNLKDNIPVADQLNIYRIVQELISNAFKHANAGYIILQCSQNESLFLITIEDDGIGFDNSGLKGKKGLGLNNIRNRVEFLKGKIDIYSVLDKGTIINIELHVYAA